MLALIGYIAFVLVLAAAVFLFAFYGVVSWLAVVAQRQVNMTGRGAFVLAVVFFALSIGGTVLIGVVIHPVAL